MGIGHDGRGAGTTGKPALVVEAETTAKTMITDDLRGVVAPLFGRGFGEPRGVMEPALGRPPQFRRRRTRWDRRADAHEALFSIIYTVMAFVNTASGTPGIQCRWSDNLP
jgi:hypothetical protein